MNEMRRTAPFRSSVRTTLSLTSGSFGLLHGGSSSRSQTYMLSPFRLSVFANPPQYSCTRLPHRATNKAGQQIHRPILQGLERAHVVRADGAPARHDEGVVRECQKRAHLQKRGAAVRCGRAAGAVRWASGTGHRAKQAATLVLLQHACPPLK